ncbi:RNA 2',3'-cyclic phosphodiesterase [Bacillus sp. H-16]|uniref:RNA 2',3'-cyclic phosphodiesterase n=1 Tax=Alteribacter salitolerans TaxID=2912333 RepID=UPI001962DC03|nr:RNA 2',3'-cyclic phosphodiesterase [Alteribacter salitolerans]MBM7096374.1 RNA 2',3'-cyclic phosphodiesterase [Alteribacter salitolerans]
MSHYFIAIPVPEKIVQPLLEAQEHFEADVRFKTVIHPDDFHITLLFFGGWDSAKRTKLWEELKTKLSKEESPALTLREINSFGRPAEPRVLWAGMSYSKPLMTLQKKIRDLAVRHEFPVEERPFTPHITLAKGYKGEKPLRLQNLSMELPEMGWDAEEVVLYEIHPHSSPRYKAVDRIILQ